MAGITWNSALALAQWTVVVLAVWATARLVLSVVCARFLPSSLSVGHVGWSSLREVEWRRVHPDSSSSSSSDSTPLHRQSHIKSIKISRVALAARSRGAKNSDRRLGWIGLAVSGVAVNVRLPAQNTAPARQEQDPDTDTSPVYDDPRETAAKSHAHAGNPPATTSRPSHSHTLWHIGELFIQSVRTIHDVRRGLRKVLLSNLPPHYRRRAVRQIGQLARGFRHKLVSPLLTRINALSRRCGRITMFLAVEVTDIAIKVPQVEAGLKIGLFRFGGELVRGHDSYLGAWARIEQVAFSTAMETVYVKKPKPSNSPKTPQSASATANNRAIELTGPLLVQAFAHFDPSIGIAGLYHRDEQGRLAPRKTILDLDFCFLKPNSSSAYGRDEAYKDTGIMTGTTPPSSIKLRLNSLLELSSRLKDVYDPLGPEPHFGPHMGPHIHPRERDFDASSYVGGEDPRSRTISSSSQGDRPNQRDFENFAELQPIPTRRNPAGMLRSIKFCIPMVKLEAMLPATNHYAPTMNSTMKSDLGGTIAFEVRLRGCAAHASLGDVLHSKDRHVEWFGKHTQLKAAIKLGFEKFDVDVMSSTDPAAPVAKSVRVLEISPSGAHLSSTWLPNRLDALFGEAQPEPENDDLGASSFASSQPPPSSPRTRLCKEGGVYNLAQDRSAQCIVLETDIGGVNGDASIGLLQAFVALWDRHKARQHPLFTHADEASETGSMHSLYVSGQLVDPPSIAVAIQLGRCGYRVTGPVTPHRTTFGPGEDDGGASPGWAAPSMICMHIPSISFNLSTRSVDIPLRRSDAQRREFRKHVKEGKLTIPDILQSENLASPEPGKIRRGSTRQLFASPVVDSRAFFASLNEREGSQSMSPVSPSEPPQNFFASFATGKVPFPKKQTDRERNSTYSGDNDFMCFIAPDDGKIPQFARHTAASSDNTGKEANRHPFVYCLDGYVTCERVEVYLLSVGEAQSLADPRANPAAHGTGSGPKRQRGSTSQPRSSAFKRGVSHDRTSSRPQLHRRHDIALLGPFEMHVGLEFMGSEMMAGEDPLKDVIFISLVDTMECSGAISLVSEALSADVSNLDVHNCLSALIEICTEDRLTLAPGDSGIFGSSEGLHSPTEHSEKTGLSHASSEQPVKPFAQLLPANIHICLAFANIDIHIAGPDPKNTPAICRGVALQVSHLSVQHFRQDRHLPLRVEPHMRAPLSLPLDVRAHAHSVFDQRGKEPLQAFIVASLRSIRINPVRDSGKASKTMRAKATVDPEGRTTTDDVEIISVTDSKWCNLPRDHFFVKKRSEAYQKRHEYDEQESSTGHCGTSRPKHAHAAIRDFFYIDEVEALICLWCMPIESSSPSERAAPVYGSWRDSATHYTQHEVVKPMQDFMGINVRIRSVVTRVEVFQLYCLLLAFSAIRSLNAQAPRTDQAMVKARRPKVRPRIKVTVAQTHVYLTLPHKVKTYIGLRRFELSTYNEDDVYMKFTKGLLAGESKLCKGMWEQILKLQSWSLAIKREPQNAGYHDRTFLLKGDSGRLRIPCKYPFSEIIDNTGTFVKICKQLIHQFVKGKFGSAIEPVAEPAKRLPEMRIMLGALVVEAMDDPFEARLNLIWNAGKAEQKARMVRDEYSEQLVEARMQEERDRQQSGAEPDTSKPSAQVLRRRLLKMKEASWIQRFKNSERRRINYETDLVKQIFGEIQTSIRNAPISIVDHHGITPLLRLIANDIDLRITKPSFGGADNALEDFLHDVGKGMLRDTEYSLLIPFHLSWRMNGLRATIRDYPIPLLCIPTAKDETKDPDDDTKSWVLDTDFVIAEQLGDHNSIRHVTATVVPAEHGEPGNRTPAYYIRVPRTAMPIKTFALPKITIKSDFATRVAWGNSMQPAIQDVMRVLESLTKTPPDPSERLGFWDKIRLILHWRIDIKFEGNAPLQLLLKGTRDPYTVMGEGAGFALSWHDGIRWKIGFDNPDKEFFQIFSSRFVLGVPDYKAYVMQTTTQNSHEKPQAREGHFKLERKKDDPKLPPGTQAEDRKELEMLKVCAKFQGGVRWGLGMQFERTCRDGSTCDHCYGNLFQRQCRMFDFKPHYAVKTISGSDATGIDLKTHDSYARFRSDFIHFSVSVTANEPGSSTNSIHLTPQGFTHFWAWWHLFDGTLSLPMRHGSVFESTAPPSKKFGKHCATIKYRLQLAPVFIAHAYKQDIVSDARKGLVTMLGVKGMMESFNVDLHQREQLERTRKPNSDEVSERLHKAFHRAEVDCVNTELRVIAARFAAVTDAEQAADGEDPEITDYLDMDEAQPVAAEDQIWLDDDDFVDLRVPLGRRQPNMHLLSCFKTPRFTYSRYSQHDTLHSPSEGDHGTSDYNSETGSEAAHSAVPKSKFGHEPTHTCLLESSSDAVDVQLAAMEKRVGELESLHQNKAENRSASEWEELKTRLHVARMGVERFKAYRARKVSTNTMPEGAEKAAQQAEYRHTLRDKEHIPGFDVFDDADQWINRLIIHNPNVVISQRIRDILLRYYYSSRQRRFFLYALTARAIKFIREHANETKTSSKAGQPNSKDDSEPTSEPRRNGMDDSTDTYDLLDELINEVTQPRGAGHAAKPERGSSASVRGSLINQDDDPMKRLREELAPSERTRNSFLVSLLKPQVCFNSDSGSHSSTVIVAAQAVQVRTCAVVNIDHIDDPINAIVRHRSFGRIDNLQAFYPHLTGWTSGRKETVLGHPNNFVPIEVLTGLSNDTQDLDRIVAPTNAQIVYDKNNRLRLVVDKESGGKSGGNDLSLDRFKVLCDRFTVTATPKHYGAIFDVVTNLLLYSDPSQKSHNQRLEQLVLSKDFSDSDDITHSIAKQQSDVRKIHDRYCEAIDNGLSILDNLNTKEFAALSEEVFRRRELLCLWLAAIQALQSSARPSKSKSLQLDARAPEIVWHMLEGDGKPLAKVAVKDIYFCWQNRSDGGVSNSLIIRDLVALNSSVSPYFPEIVTKHPYGPSNIETRFGRADIFIAVIWSMLSPVGGISIVDHFQLHLHPIRLQMEQVMADQIKHYIFSQREMRNKDDAATIASRRSEDTAKSSQLSVRSQLPKSKSNESLSTARKTAERRDLKMTSSQQNLSVPSSSASQAPSGTRQPSSRPRSLYPSSEETLSLQMNSRDDHLDAAEMRERARLNRTFLHVELFPTVLCLSFKGDKNTSLPDVYGLIYKSPTIIHCNRIWTYLDLLENIKKDFKSSIWSQSATLIGQLLTTARKPKNAVQQTVSRSLGFDKGDRQRRKSLTASIRSRLSVGGHPEDRVESRSSPLRTSTIQEIDHDHDDDENENNAEEEESDSDSSGHEEVVRISH